MVDHTTASQASLEDGLIGALTLDRMIKAIAAIVPAKKATIAIMAYVATAGHAWRIETDDEIVFYLTPATWKAVERACGKMVADAEIVGVTNLMGAKVVEIDGRSDEACRLLRLFFAALKGRPV